MSEVIPVNITDEVKDSFLTYAMSTIVERALPDVRDGLKPVQRRILYAMHADLNLISTRKHSKSAGVVGEVIKKYHPHGDMPIYEAMVRMAQWWNLRYMLVDGQGNFGSLDGDPPAAYRYTEARLTKAAEVMLEDIEKETVSFRPNFDESHEEPTVLPAAFPYMLVNGAVGIAVGMATNIPPHNLTEICNGLLEIIKNPEITLDELMQFVTGPDFPTGGRLGKKGIREAYATGQGSIRLRGKSRIEEVKGRSQIVITEIPYQVNKENFIKTISMCYREGKIPDISALRDESDRKDPVRIVLELKRGTLPDLVLNQLYKHTQLQSSFNIINLAIVNGAPKVLPIKDAMVHYLDHRKVVVTKRTEYDLKKARARSHILEGLLLALDNIDEIIRLIRASSGAAEAREALIGRFAFSDSQAQAILDMRLQTLTGLSRDRLSEEYRELLGTIGFLEGILGDTTILWNEIVKEITNLRDKFGDERRTVITDLSEDITKEDLIAIEDMVITVTKAGYIKRTALEAYRVQARNGRGSNSGKLREEDTNINLLIGSTHDFLLFFTDKGRVFREKIFDIPEAGRDAKGVHLRNVLPLRDDESVASILDLKDFKVAGALIFCTKQGIIKKTEIADYINITSAGLIAINLLENDDLIEVGVVKPNEQVVLATREGQSIRFSEDDVRATGRATQGVIGIRLKEKDVVVSMSIVQPDDGGELLAVSENGYGKRTPIAEYPVQGRGGQGVITLKVTDKTGNLVSLERVGGDEELMVLSAGGVAIRTRVEEVSSYGRSSQGVKIMRIEDKDMVIRAFAIRQEETL